MTPITKSTGSTGVPGTAPSPHAARLTRGSSSQESCPRFFRQTRSGSLWPAQSVIAAVGSRRPLYDASHEVDPVW